MTVSSNLTERIEKCEMILKENTDSQVFAPLADALRMTGDLDQAFRICRQGLRRHPDYGSGRLVMAKINLARRMYDWAAEELDEAVRCDGETRVSEQLRIEIVLAKHDFEQAEKLLKKMKASGVNQLYIREMEKQIKKEKTAFAREQVNKGKQAVPASPESVDSVVRQSDSPIREQTILTVSDALDLLCAIENVERVVCAHIDGTTVDCRGDFNGGKDETAAFAAELCRVAETENAAETLGHLRQILVESDDLLVVTVRFTRYVFAIFCRPDVNIGSLRLKLDEIQDCLEQA